MRADESPIGKPENRTIGINNLACADKTLKEIPIVGI